MPKLRPGVSKKIAAPATVAAAPPDVCTKGNREQEQSLKSTYSKLAKIIKKINVYFTTICEFKAFWL